MFAKRSLGQNFLIDKNYQQKIISSLGDLNQKTVLEIGPGRGAISQHLIEQPLKKLILIEKDTDLALALRNKYQDLDFIKIINEDFLKVNLSEIFKPHEQVIVVGNLPYNISSQIFIKLVQNHQYFSKLYLMFQKEMAKRFHAQPKTKDYGLLTIWSLIYSETKKLFDLPPTVFKPQPKVVSSFLEFKLFKNPKIKDHQIEDFFKIIKDLFNQRRKTIHAILKKKINSEILNEKSFQEFIGKKRVEEMGLEELIQLFEKIVDYSSV
jgi:16S rRNA (adenine1518-N6/adenine1519-N6)-dimethyltransferase